MLRIPTERAGVRRRRRIGALLIFVAGIAVAVTVGGGGGGGGDRPRPERPQPFSVGAGAHSARVLPARGGRRRATVVFLHGWGLTGPKAYDAWLRHLTSRGSTVIVPRYQTGLRTDSEEVPDNALAGIRAALRRLRPRPRAVVVIGHSVGGVLAVDYAARARAVGLPPAQSMMVVYPGGALKDMPAVPEDDAAQIPSSVRRLLVLASPTDNVVGTAPAEAIFAGAVNLRSDRRELITVDDSVAGDHFAPAVGSAAARREFWRRADRLVRLAD